MQSSKVNNLLIWFLIVAIVASVSYTFYKSIILGDFQVVESPDEE